MNKTSTSFWFNTHNSQLTFKNDFIIPVVWFLWLFVCLVYFRIYKTHYGSTRLCFVFFFAVVSTTSAQSINNIWVCLSAYLPACLSTYLLDCVCCVSVHLSVCLSHCVSCLSVRLSVWLSVHIHWQTVCLYVFLPVYLSISQSVSLPSFSSPLSLILLCMSKWRNEIHYCSVPSNTHNFTSLILLSSNFFWSLLISYFLFLWCRLLLYSSCLVSLPCSILR